MEPDTPKMAAQDSAAHAKISKIKAVKSMGLPLKYANSFEWARDWCMEHGMTLPPDTDEYRSLRNWFCFKLNQYKKATLGEKNEALLAHYGLDFSQYEALNTGKVERESDHPYVLELKAHKANTGSYDLDHSAPVGLIAWQAKILTRVEDDGISRRMREFLRDVPDLNVGLWMRPNDTMPSAEEREWWRQANQYEVLAASFAPYQGVQHPEMPEKMKAWAAEQQAACKRCELSRRATGWMRGVGLLVNISRKLKTEKMRKASLEIHGGESNFDAYGANDRRLCTIRGAINAITAVQSRVNDRALMVEFGIDPPTAVALRKHITKHAGGAHWHKHQTTPCRMIALNFSNAFSTEFWKTIERNPLDRPANLTPAVEALGRLALSVVKAFGNQNEDSKPLGQRAKGSRELLKQSESS